MEKSRVRKQNACTFCGKLFKKISQHLLNVHKDEEDIKKIEGLKETILDKNELIRQRRKLFSKLEADGNYKYNMSVRARKGPLEDYIPRYNQTQKKGLNINDLTPCAYCKHLYRAKFLHRHKCSEDYKQNTVCQIKVPIVKISRAKWLDLDREHDSASLRALLSSLRNDESSSVIKSDPWLIRFAVEALKGLCDNESDEDDDEESNAECNNDIDVNSEEKLGRLRQSLRDLARYLSIFRSESKNMDLALIDTFNPHYKQHVPKVIKRYCTNFSAPHTGDSLRRTIGKFLKFYVNDIPEGDDDFQLKTRQIRDLQANSFQHIWTKTINPKLQASKIKKNIKKKANIPTHEEIKKFNNYVNENINQYLKKNIKTYKEYIELCRLTHSRLTSLNFRRSGEIARMTIHQFNNRQKNKAISSSATKIEKICARYMEVVTLKGKSSQNEIVNAIIPPNCVKAIKKILATRKHFCDLKDNKFVFATIGQRQFHINGSSTIRVITKKCGINDLTKFTASNLRKFIATEMMWRNIDVPHRKLLASHMGHLLSTHENIYTEHMRDDTAMFQKIPAMLLNVEAGNTTKCIDQLTDEDVEEYIKKACLAS